MLSRIGQLERDLDAISAGEALPPASWNPDDDEIGPALIAAASGKHIWSDLYDQDTHKKAERRRVAAQRYLTAVLFHPTSTHYALLAARADGSMVSLRENYRRMIALVHPDAQPVGFPLDAATRVNRAYDLLADTAKRVAYDQSLSQNSANLGKIVEKQSERDRAPKTGGRTQKSTASRVGLLKRFGIRASRRSLLWLAAALVVPAIAVVYLMSAESEPGVRLVEARPALEMSAEVVPPTSPVVPPEVALNAPTSVAAATDTISPSPRLSNDLSAASRRMLDAASTPPVGSESATPQVAAAAVPTPSAKTPAPARPSVAVKSGAPNSLAATPSAYAATATDRSKAEPSIEPIAGPTSSPATPQAASAVPATTINVAAIASPSEPVSRIRSVDVEELLARFASAYESGSPPALSALFAQGLPNRRVVLSEYEQVFRDTRQRTIRFSQVKHRWAGERVTTSGLVALTMVGQDGQPNRQNAFVEIETALEANSLRITRLANYAQR